MPVIIPGVKNCCLAILLLFVLNSELHAQAVPADSLKNSVTVEPIDLIWKIHVQYERMLSSKISVAAGFHYYYEDLGFITHKTYKAELIGRYYYDPAFFFQGILLGYQYLDYDNSNKHTGGVGICWGSRRVFRNIPIVLDASVGLQYSKYIQPWQPYYSDAGFWYTTGAGSILIARMAIGYAF